jgi:hypothetical protein
MGIDEVVRLRLPAEPLSLQLIRLSVYLVASRMDFDLSRVEDLNLAVEEAGRYVLEKAGDGLPLLVEIIPAGDYLDIVLTSKIARDREGACALPDTLAQRILKVLLDGFEVKREGDFCRLFLRKRRFP